MLLSDRAQPSLDGFRNGDERAGAGARSRLARPGDAEAAALVRSALDGDLAFEQLDDLARERQAKPDPAVRAREPVVNLPEALEDEGKRVARDADACVLDLNLPPIRPFDARRHRDAARRRELDGVTHEARDDLRQLPPVRAHSDQLRR